MWYGWDDSDGLCEALDPVGEARGWRGYKEGKREAHQRSSSDMTEVSARGLSFRDHSAGASFLSFPLPLPTPLL